MKLKTRFRGLLCLFGRNKYLQKKKREPLQIQNTSSHLEPTDVEYMFLGVLFTLFLLLLIIIAVCYWDMVHGGKAIHQDDYSGYPEMPFLQQDQ